MAEELKSLITDLGTTFEQFKKANDARLADIEAKGKADPLLEEQVQKMADRMAEIEDLKGRVEQAETAAARKATTADNGDMETKAAEFYAQVCKNKGIQATGSFSAKELTAYKSAFREMMQKGDLMSLDAQKALSVGSDPDGGYTVDPDTNGRIVTQIFETSPMRQVAAVQTIGTDALEGTYDLNEASAAWVGETGSRTETNTPQLGKWRIPVHELYAFPFATQKLLDDSMVDMESWLAAKVADKFARTENAAFVNGDGVGKPRGFLTYAAGTTLPGTIQQHNTGVSGGFAASGAGGDVLLDAIYSLKQSYRSGARWAMPRSATAEVRKIKDADGQYIWQPGIAAGQPASLLGFPVVEFEDMPDIAADSLSIAFANWSEAYQIVDRQGVRVLRDPYTNKPYVGFYTVKRTGGDVLNFEAIKLIKFAV
jgi:HK97 family phage major capsid protein